MKKLLRYLSIIIGGLFIGAIAFAQINEPQEGGSYKPGFALQDGSKLNYMYNSVVNLTHYHYRLVTANPDTYTISNEGALLLDVGGGANSVITQETITAPPNPFNGQRIFITSTRTVNTFAFVANTGQSLATATPTVLTASTTAPQGYTWIFRGLNLTWYRLQ